MQRLLGQFLQLESASGVILFLMAVLAMIWANSPLAFLREDFLNVSLFWINDGLMAVFFLVVGLELKRGYLDGRLSSVSQMMLPVVAATGGMVLPALIYIGFNYHSPETIQGWATPVATDIAFALAVLTLFGRRVPGSLKLFLLALAIFDDLGAIVIIALFYSRGLSYLWLSISLALMLALYLLNVLSVRSLWPYLALGVFFLVALLRCGVHPTIGGVLLALAIPDKAADGRSPLRTLENALHPWVAFLIMPLFALANAGFSLDGMTWQVITDQVVMGIALGLFLGKQIGVFGFTWLLVHLRFARLPFQSSWMMLYGVALLCGIGFTMSLFLGTLSFQNGSAIHLAEVRLGVILGSVLSGLTGALVLGMAFARKQEEKE